MRVAMRSAAHIKGHPIHPILIAFPIAFLPGALVGDVVGWLFDSRPWWTTAAYLSVAGVISAFVAAVPGFIDYLMAVPPRSSGKRRATYHMTVNLTATGLFIAGFFVRDWTHEDPPSLLLLALELAGAAFLTVGGWLGGTLVYRNFIGTEHRYAGAGKWKEDRRDLRPGEPVEVGPADELKVNQMKLLHLGTHRVVVARTENGYAAFQDHCTHRGGSLADGVLICGTVQCLWHGSQFDVHSGQIKSGPTEKPIATYEVRELGGKLYLTFRPEAERD